MNQNHYAQANRHRNHTSKQIASPLTKSRSISMPKVTTQFRNKHAEQFRFCPYPPSIFISISAIVVYSCKMHKDII